MELKIENNKLIINGKETTLTDEQLKELGIKVNPFDIEYGDEILFIKLSGDIGDDIFNNYSDEDFNLLEAGKICKNEKLME